MNIKKLTNSTNKVSILNSLNWIKGMMLFLICLIVLIPKVSMAVEQIKARSNSDLTSIITPLKAIKFVKFTFTETRHSFFYKQPKISRGEMLIKKPFTMIKTIIFPEYKKYEINNNELIISLSKNKLDKNNQLIILSDHPKLSVFILLIRALFNANISFIQEYYDISVDIDVGKKIGKDQNKKRWLLTLSPKNTGLNSDGDNLDFQTKTVREIKITGYQDQLISIHSLGFMGESTFIAIDKIIKEVRAKE